MATNGKGMDLNKRMEIALPHLQLIKNTANFQMLLMLLKDIYRINVSEITKANWREINDRIIKYQKKEKNFSEKILKKYRCEKLYSAVYAKESVDFLNTNKKAINDRIYPVAEDRFHYISPDFINTLETETGVKCKIKDAEQFQKIMDVVVEDHFKKDIIYYGFALNSKFLFQDTDKKGLDNIIRKHAGGEKLLESEQDYLVSYRLKRVMEEVGKLKIPLWMPLGVWFDTTIAYHQYHCNAINTVHKLAVDYPDTNIMLCIGGDALMQDLLILARQLHNVYLVNNWWHSFYPQQIKNAIRARIELLPVNKNILFHSESRTLEGSYAKNMELRHLFAEVLAEKVENKELTEALARQVAQAWLYENPKSVFEKK